ncbi:RING finger protein 112-like [Lithobates pipiens]
MLTMLTMLTKIQLAVKKMGNRQIPPPALQLVYKDSDGKLQLNERVLQSCFLQKKVSKYPLYLICGIGERRKGKSSLLNYILRALHCLERGQPVNLGQDDDLPEFEWRSGIDSVTKGIWIWSKPFILERNGEKMAVFVLDMEGSLDIEGDQEICPKLSALSMLLSSHLIIHANATLNTTELDYLEKYVNWSKLMEDSSLLQHLQHLDVLVRDSKDPDRCGREAVHVYLQHEREKLTMREDSKYNLVMDTLRSPSVSCFLLPPGNKFPKSSQGTLADMDEDFRHHLTTYISDLVEGIWPHHQNISGEKITCGHVGKELKDLVSILQREECSFTSSLQMSNFLRNWKQLKTFLQAYQKYLDQQSPDDASALDIFGVRPPEMKSRVSKKIIQFQEKYTLSLRGDNAAEKELLMEEMTSQLTEKQERFCDKYSKRFTMCTINIGSAIGGTALGMVGPIAGEVGFIGLHNHSGGQRAPRS